MEIFADWSAWKEKRSEKAADWKVIFNNQSVEKGKDEEIAADRKTEEVIQSARLRRSQPAIRWKKRNGRFSLQSAVVNPPNGVWIRRIAEKRNQRKGTQGKCKWNEMTRWQRYGKIMNIFRMVQNHTAGRTPGSKRSVRQQKSDGTQRNV